MTTVENDTASFSPTIPAIDAAIANALGVRFSFLPQINRLLPQRYTTKSHRPDVVPATIGRETGCSPPHSPDCENCQVWNVCAEIQAAIE